MIPRTRFAIFKAFKSKATPEKAPAVAPPLRVVAAVFTAVPNKTKGPIRSKIPPTRPTISLIKASLFNFIIKSPFLFFSNKIVSYLLLKKVCSDIIK